VRQPQSPWKRNLGRVVEIVATDLLVRDTSRAIRPRQARVPVDLHRLDRSDQSGLLPRALHSRVRRFVARGDEGFVAHVDGRFSGWVWLSRVSHRDPYSGLLIRLAPDEAYAYALFVEPEDRPHGVAAVLMTEMLRAVADDAELTRVYGWVDQRNRESQVLLRLLGFERVQEVRRLHVLHRFGRAVPRTAHPAYGPLSAAGRHSLPA
jgi:GNAT superfamily N-acetyltransferase